MKELKVLSQCKIAAAMGQILSKASTITTWSIKPTGYQNLLIKLHF
jgi:hypothetical protein